MLCDYVSVKEFEKIQTCQTAALKPRRDSPGPPRRKGGCAENLGHHGRERPTCSPVCVEATGGQSGQGGRAAEGPPSQQPQPQVVGGGGGGVTRAAVVPAAREKSPSSITITPDWPGEEQPCPTYPSAPGCGPGVGSASPPSACIQITQGPCKSRDGIQPHAF